MAAWRKKIKNTHMGEADSAAMVIQHGHRLSVGELRLSCASGTTLGNLATKESESQEKNVGKVKIVLGEANKKRGGIGWH